MVRAWLAALAILACPPQADASAAPAAVQRSTAAAPAPPRVLPVTGRLYRVLTDREFQRRMKAKGLDVHPERMTYPKALEDLSAIEQAVQDVWRMRWDKGVRLVAVSQVFARAREDLPQTAVATSRFRVFLEGVLKEFDDSHLYLMTAGDELGRISDPQPPVTWKRLPPGDVGWIRVDRFPEPGQPFGADFPLKVDEAFAALADTRGLVIDLRGNAGGDPNQTDRLFDHLASTKVFLYAEVVRRSEAMSKYLGPESLAWWDWPDGGEFSHPAVVDYEPKDAPKYAGKVLALCDSGTVSAGEYFAGSLKDNGLALIAGERTAGGSGSVVPVELPNSRLTAAIPIQHTLRKDGTPIQRSGIPPDVRINPRADDVERQAAEALRKMMENRR